jgi:hypothetical protein
MSCRAMDTVTQELIDTLTALLRKHPAAALQSLQVGAPALIDSLHVVRSFAVDRREISASLVEGLKGWLARYPQPEEASNELLSIRASLDLPEIRLPEGRASLVNPGLGQ